VRVPTGLLAVLVVPGYALTAVLFPSDEHVDRIERLALALGVSIALVGMQAYALDWVSGGLSPENIRTCVAATSACLLVVALIKRGQVVGPAVPGLAHVRALPLGAGSPPGGERLARRAVGAGVDAA
jgi:uncharacterized membrane protein